MKKLIVLLFLLVSFPLLSKEAKAVQLNIPSPIVIGTTVTVTVTGADLTKKYVVAWDYNGSRQGFCNAAFVYSGTTGTCTYNTTGKTTGSYTISLRSDNIYGSVITSVQVALVDQATATATPAPNPNCGAEGQVCCNINIIERAYCNSGLSCFTRQGQYPICVAYGATPAPTATLAPNCGNVADDPCCAGKCSTNLFLYCTGTPSLCSSFANYDVSVSDQVLKWSNTFDVYDENLDFNDDGTVTGADYALWLKAGNSL